MDHWKEKVKEWEWDSLLVFTFIFDCVMKNNLIPFLVSILNLGMVILSMYLLEYPFIQSKNNSHMKLVKSSLKNKKIKRKKLTKSV